MPDVPPPPPLGPPPSWRPPPPSYAPPPPPKSRTGLVVVLVVVLLLLVGGAGTGFVLWQEREDDSPSATDDTDASPTEEPSTEPVEPVEPVEPSSAPVEPTTPEPGNGLPVDPPSEQPAEPEPEIGPLSDEPVSFREFKGDWDYRLEDVRLKAAYRSGQDHADCGPVERKRALSKLGCVRAAEWSYRALRGDLALAHVVLTMRTPKAAARAIDEKLITEESWRLQPSSYLADRPGAWKAVDVGQFVVLSVVTHEPSVALKKASPYLEHGNNDVRGALGFRF